MRNILCHCTPLPPARNGIADYAFRIAAVLSPDYDSVALCNDPFAVAPPGVSLMDPRQAFRLPREQTCFLHQIGNNWDHAFVLQTALAYPGVVILHDLKLLYLYESLGLPKHEMLSAMLRSNPRIGRARGEAYAIDGCKQRFDHLLFDMLADVVGTAKAIVVHTEFARNVLVRQFGQTAADKVRVIPHFAMEARPETRERARTRLSLDRDWFVVVTSGFATRPKRFDLLVEALDRLVARHRKVIWVQAGPVRPDEYDLERVVASYPRVRKIMRLTGYLTERDLDGYVTAADVLVNLRFPSVGESSGSLARALAAGTCCIVSDTAGYRELPDSVAIKISPHNGVEPLVAALAGLLEDPGMRDAYGQEARIYARGELSLDCYLAKLRSVIDCFGGTPSRRDIPAALPLARTERKDILLPIGCTAPPPVPPRVPVGAALSVRIGPFSSADLTFGAAERLAPEGMRVNTCEISLDAAGGVPAAVYLTLSGYSVG